MTLASSSNLPAEWPLLERLEEDFPQRQIISDRQCIAVRTCGEGPAVVLLHGIGSGAASWLQVAQRLASRARVVAWDAPGYGDSSALSATAPKAEDYAKRLNELLDVLHIEHCLLVGHSLGALTGLAYASSQASKRIDGLLLISPAQGYGSTHRRAMGDEVRSRRFRNLENLGIAGTAEQRSPHMLSPRATAIQLAWVRWNMARLKPHGYRQAVELLCGDDLLRHGVPPVPVEVHCGEYDSITLPDDCNRIAQELNADFSLIPQAGHASPIEQPDIVAERIACALETYSKGTRS